MNLCQWQIPTSTLLRRIPKGRKLEYSKMSEVLLKAHKLEQSPYRAINEYITQMEKYAYEVTKMLMHSVCSILDIKGLRKAHTDAPLIFKGQIQYNPKTGKPITKKEWKKFEQAVIKFLGIEKNQMQEKMVRNSFWLGSLINRLSKQQRKATSIKKIDLSEPDFKAVGYKDYENNLIEATEQSTGIYIQNVNDKARSKIQQVIIEGTKQRKTKHEIFSGLWDIEEDINRDWDRVIRTEVATNANNGILLTTLSTSDEEHVFMKGVSAPNACPHCQELVRNKVVALIKEPPESGEMVEVNGKEYAAIWPGKSNYGRKASDYWAATTIHPYCRCTWTEWYPELEKYFEED